jgi:hypothetical protein
VLKGFDDAMAATEDDKKIFLAVKLRDPNLLKGTPYYVEPPEPPSLPPGPPGAPRRNGDAADGPPAPTRGRAGSRQESVRASAHILGAADLALLRCRELAGIRVRQKCRECAPGVPISLIASAVGQIDAGDPILLVKDGASSFYALLLERGFGEAHAGSLAQTLEIFAAKTLFHPEQPDLPAAFEAQVQNAQEAVLALAHQ